MSGEALNGSVELHERVSRLEREGVQLRAEWERTQTLLGEDIAWKETVSGKLDHLTALCQGTAARVARLDNERELPIKNLAAIKKDVAAIKRLELEQVRHDERIRMLERRGDELEEDVEDTQRRQAADAIALARELAHEDRASIVEEKRAQREVKLSVWWTKNRWGAGWAVFLLGLGAFITWAVQHFAR